MLSSMLGEVAQPCHLQVDFADCWRPNASVSHGYRLYKRYLQALHLLDEVYGPQHGHAYIKEHKGIWHEIVAPYRLNNRR